VPYAKRASAPSVESLRVTGWLRYAPIARDASRARGRGDLTPEKRHASTDHVSD
jgi:hypothetical protein